MAAAAVALPPEGASPEDACMGPLSPRDDSEELESADENLDGHRFAPEETLLIFDWDDTVMPSSWVLDEGLRVDDAATLTEKQQEHLSELARLAARTLRMASRLGTVLLVTNAERGWVELSCKKFMPSLLPSLATVKTLSARTEYESADVPSPFEWKLKAFNNEISRVFDIDPDSKDTSQPRRKNILSFGDSGHEREAVINATANMPDTRTKSLKFIDRPGVEELRKQHALIVKCMKQIVHHDGNLDLCIKLAN
eukprot:TRINITY_DN4867_c1_g1_i1.p1 TRINITY_DN4867_c1_g1~~TRINITY_DN4867_c1_g1_i1.p1  ORF type:complete len:254 (-),score=66.07 TRINITY_DN4867_c1_g1_i1:116-877(-)